MSGGAYGTSPVKRQRRTNAELEVVDAAIYEAVSEEHPATVRGIFYRVESAGVVPKTEKGYALVCRELLKMRRAGAIPYGWITDGTRLIRKDDSWDDLRECLEDTAAAYRRALWRDQEHEVMVFTEKDAISGILYPVTNKWDVPLGVMRGYASETFCYSVAEEIIGANRRGKWVYVYQFGDHDPSGVNAWENFERKIVGFCERRSGAVLAYFRRLAVTPEQIFAMNLPTRPTKKSDTRAKDFAGESVEVDAVPASVLRAIVEDAIVQHIDPRAMELTALAEQQERAHLERIAAACGRTPEP